MVVTAFGCALIVPFVVVLKGQSAGHAMCISQQGVDICERHKSSIINYEMSPKCFDFRTLVRCFTFIRSGAGPLSVGVVSLPQMRNVPLYHHQTSSHSHLPLGSPLQYFPTAAPPQHRESGVASKRAEGLRFVRQIEPQTGAGAQIEEAMLGDPLPEHTARGPLAVAQHQVGAIHCDAALQRFTLQDEEAFFWDEDTKETLLHIST